MRKLKTYHIHFTSRTFGRYNSGNKKVIDIRVNAFSIKEALSWLRVIGYTISKDYYYFVVNK